MEEILYKRCSICGKYYDIKEDTGEQMCYKCSIQNRLKKLDKNIGGKNEQNRN